MLSCRIRKSPLFHPAPNPDYPEYISLVKITAIRNKRARQYVLLGLVALDLLLMALGRAPALAILISVGLLIYAFIRILGMMLHRSRLIWSLRSRLYVTYVFIGAVPIVLILALTYFGAWIVVGQVATYLVRSELSRRASTMTYPARVLSRAKARDRAAILNEMAPLFRDRVPGLEVLITDDTGEPDLRYPPANTLEPPPPGWGDYTGLVSKSGRYYLMSFAREARASTLMMAPLGPRVLEKLVPGIGEIRIASQPGSSQPAGEPGSGGKTIAGEVPPAYTAIDTPFEWVNPVDFYHWRQPGKVQQCFLYVTTRTSAVLSVIFAEKAWAADATLVLFVIIVILLAIVELVSAIIGISMTNAITGAVHSLYEGTLSISRGDFSHRIPVKGRDQLADLGNSFNQMTEQLENLVVVAKEKERLQSELSIACEVQKQLFPRSAPSLETIELLGACEPARSASGDYYDYLLLPSGNLALAIGDVAGKGISAALLMASIQSIMRTQLLAGQTGHISTAAIVAQLNRQLYGNTSPEKYATFFFGIYEEASRVLKYTNAGHLSPLILRDGKVNELQVTGTVVGLFPASEYEEQRVTLAASDILVAFTDGITEPENAYGEEFGAERLSDTVLRHQNAETCEIVAKVMEAVRQWSNAPELPDDMTVLIAKGRA
jgi:phosphoserine phosphatase RsbU/P